MLHVASRLNMRLLSFAILLPTVLLSLALWVSSQSFITRISPSVWYTRSVFGLSLLKTPNTGFLPLVCTQYGCYSFKTLAEDMGLISDDAKPRLTESLKEKAVDLDQLEERPPTVAKPLAPSTLCNHEPASLDVFVCLDSGADATLDLSSLEASSLAIKPPARGALEDLNKPVEVLQHHNKDLSLSASSSKRQSDTFSNPNHDSAGDSEPIDSSELASVDSQSLSAETLSSAVPVIEQCFYTISEKAKVYLQYSPLIVSVLYFLTLAATVTVSVWLTCLYYKVRLELEYMHCF